MTFPLILIAYGQSTGALFGGGAVTLSLVLGGVAWTVGILLLVNGMRSLTRGRLLGVASES